MLVLSLFQHCCFIIARSRMVCCSDVFVLIPTRNKLLNKKADAAVYPTYIVRRPREGFQYSAAILCYAAVGFVASRVVAAAQGVLSLAR